ncbi:MAG: helix-turn-helix transcriptional regulator, partial [Peptostreptococcaceae bacterium]
MKADRLISILMLLQIHKQLTAKDLAIKLEVSVRTIYRDIDSLSSLGIPIFTDRGTNGGIRLLGEYRTTLNGINKDELCSLFIPTGNKVLDDLGIEKIKESTMLKLLGNSSTDQIIEINNLQNYIYIDMNTWNENQVEVDKNILSILQSGIWNSKVLNL